jgi:hypothetical protein
MSLLKDAITDKIFDVRMVEKNINRGFTSDSDHQKLMKNLPDDTDAAEFVDIEAIAKNTKKDSSYSSSH